MDIRELFKRVVDGKMTLTDVEGWVETFKADYQRPLLMEKLGDASGQELDRLVDEYSDWEIRIAEFGRTISEYAELAGKLVDVNPNRAVLIAKVRCLLSKLTPHPMNIANANFQLGYILWKTQKYFDSVQPLSEAAETYRQSGDDDDHLMEITALSYLSDALHQDKQYDHALSTADDLVDRAMRYGFRGHVALALRDKGQVLASLGRAQDSLDCLRRAIDERRKISDKEAYQQTVVSLGAFLDAYGQAARRFGHFEDAIKTFSELTEFQRKTGDVSLQARAISDVGYTYQQAGEMSQAIRYLEEAVSLAESSGALSDATRWRIQIGIMKGETTTKTLPSFAEHHSPIKDSKTAYLQNAQAQQLAFQKNYSEAEFIARRVLEWAQYEKDTHLEISARNTLGSCYMNNDQLPKAIVEFQKGIQLADWFKDDQASLSLRYNLAKTYIYQRAYQRSADVLLSGIGYSQQRLAQTETAEFRQQVVAGSIALYELFALLLAYKDSEQNHKWLLAITELVRARNLYGWLKASHSIETIVLRGSVKSMVSKVLQDMRAVEVELEVRHLTRKIAFDEIVAVQQRRESNLAMANKLLKQYGLPGFTWNSQDEDDPFAANEKLIEELLQPGLAIICLFSVPEGICPVVMYRNNGEEVVTKGKLISWDRDERQKALAQWTGNTDFYQHRGKLSITQRDAVRLEAGQTSRLERLLNTFQMHMMNELVKMVEEIGPEKIVVIPHRELAIIPYWGIVSQCHSVESITLVPSMNVLRLCLARQRSVRGPSVLVSDLTNTLPQAANEISVVRQARRDNIVAEPSTINDLLQTSQKCSLLHISAHGYFNTENPYYSGFLAAKHEKSKGIFVQYATLPSFQLSEKPDSQSIRLMTVAECMTMLSLESCRLAILSTCESGMARQHGGGELVGLPNSLLVAGAKSVIASLWPVHDTATALLMHYFYATWEGGSGRESSPARALSGARHKLRTATRKDIRNVLGTTVNIPEGDIPFDHPIYSDAFHCFGSW